MSSAEIDRFQSDLKANSELAKTVREAGFGLAAITEVANTRGYDFEHSELKSYVSEQSAGVLTDEQLASVAAAGSTWTHSTTAAVSNTIGFTEVAVAVIAVGVAVLT